MVSSCPVESVGDRITADLPRVFSACVSTHAMSNAVSVGKSDESEVEFLAPSLSDFPLSVSSTELVQEQQSGSSLKVVFDGYFVQNG